MTRQKKEIIKQINNLRTGIEIDLQLSYGYAPPGVHDHVYKEIYELEEKLAKLSHYNSVEEMYHDEREMAALMSRKEQLC